MTDNREVTGGCHCERVRFKATVDLAEVITCNCSICSKTGAMLAFTPASAFVLQSGEDNLTDYQFGKKNIHHLFCKTCGIRSFGRGTMPDGTKMVGINVRCLDGIDPATISATSFDGKSLL